MVFHYPMDNDLWFVNYIPFEEGGYLWYFPNPNSKTPVEYGVSGLMDYILYHSISIIRYLESVSFGFVSFFGHYIITLFGGLSVFPLPFSHQFVMKWIETIAMETWSDALPFLLWTHCVTLKPFMIHRVHCGLCLSIHHHLYGD